jgi:low affinity iron permease
MSGPSLSPACFGTLEGSFIHALPSAIEERRAVKGARNKLISLEGLSDENLKNLEKQFERVRKRAERDGQSGRIEPS